jgi:hypothetical protein
MEKTSKNNETAQLGIGDVTTRFSLCSYLETILITTNVVNKW